MTQEPMVTCYSIRGPGHTVEVPASQMGQREAIYAIIVHRQRVLLIKIKTTGLLWFPGGGTDGELLFKALARELKEEVGITRFSIAEEVHRVNLPFIYDPPRMPEHRETFWNEAHFFRCTVQNDRICSDEEVDDLEGELPRWYPVSELTPEHFQNIGETLLELCRHCAKLERTATP